MHCVQKYKEGKKTGGLGLRVILTLDHQSSSSVHVDSPGGVWEARIAGVLWLVVLRLLLGLVVVILLLLLIMRRRLLLLLLILLILRMLLLLLLLLLLTVLIVATTTRVLHHRIESLVHASDSSCTTRGRAVRGEVFALGI
jgi:hypothetical protein